jgi:TPR repeat protein
MKPNAVLTSFLAVLIATAHGATPGDAALRSNHPQQAAELYRRRAGQGDALAARKLAFLLEDHPEMSTGFGTIGTWFLKGCELGDLASCHNRPVSDSSAKMTLPLAHNVVRLFKLTQ